VISRTSAAAWWCSPVASILLVVSGLGIVFWEAARGEHATPLILSAGIGLVGLGVTGRIQAWATGSPKSEEEKKGE